MHRSEEAWNSPRNVACDVLVRAIFDGDSRSLLRELDDWCFDDADDRYLARAARWLADAGSLYVAVEVRPGPDVVVTIPALRRGLAAVGHPAPDHALEYFERELIPNAVLVFGSDTIEQLREYRWRRRLAATLMDAQVALDAGEDDEIDRRLEEAARRIGERPRRAREVRRAA